MKTFGADKATKIMKDRDFPLGLTYGQQISVYWWLVFDKKKFDIFIEELDKGYTNWSAYITARKILK